MAEVELSRNIEEALNVIVNTTDKSGNMKKELRKTIYETLSTLRNLFIKMKVTLEEGTKQKHQTDKENNAMNTELAACRRENSNTHAEGKLEPSTDNEREPPRSTNRQVLPPHGHPTKPLYSDVLARREGRKFKLSYPGRDTEFADGKGESN